MKQIIRALMDKNSLTDAEQLRVERLEQEAEESRGCQEGVKSFMEDRKPEFEGR